MPSATDLPPTAQMPWADIRPLPGQCPPYGHRRRAAAGLSVRRLDRQTELLADAVYLAAPAMYAATM
jgi:hypothetical protein